MADPQVLQELKAQLQQLELALQLTPDQAPTAELRREAEAAIKNYWRYKSEFLQAIEEFESSSNKVLQDVEASLATSRQQLQEVEEKKKQIKSGPTATIPADLTRTLEHGLLEAMGYLIPPKTPVPHDYKRHIEDWAASNLLTGAANPVASPAAAADKPAPPASVFALWADWSSATTSPAVPAASEPAKRSYERMESWLFSSAVNPASNQPASDKQ